MTIKQTILFAVLLSMGALNTTMAYCVQCHATFRQ